MTPALYARAERAVQVLAADGRRFEAGRAVLFVLDQIGWHPRLVRLAQRRPLVWLVEIGYRLVARNRGFFGRSLFRHTDASDR